MLAELLRRSNEAQSAAAVNESLWKRLGNTPDGVEAGRRAVQQYYAFGNADGWTKSATLADEMVDKLPAGVELEFQVWHERAPTGLKAKPEWNRGRVKLTIPADGDVVTLDVPVDPALLP